MPIKKLPQYLINKLKAGEIVERPASVVKEIIENSLDAGADEFVLTLEDGGKSLIKLEDNGSGIQIDDLPNSIARYATSKIKDESDLMSIGSYGFRGEALASISEISKFTIQTKTSDSPIANELTKIGQDINTAQIGFHKDHGTILYVKNIFYNTPARLKFLKSAATEYKYIYNLFLQFAHIHWDKSFQLIKDGKSVLNLTKAESLLERLQQIHKKDWQKNFINLEYGDKDFHIYGVISDSGLSFLNQDHIKLFVNKRPVTDKIIKRALLQSYYRQLAHGEYPFATLFLDLPLDFVDVNVHPRKTEVKFIDPGSVYNFVEQAVKQHLSSNQIVGGTISSVSDSGASSSGFYGNSSNSQLNNHSYNFAKQAKNLEFGNNKPVATSFEFQSKANISTHNSFDSGVELNVETENNDYKIIGQIWDSYIILQTNSDIYFVDQHAVAERIAFDNFKKDLNENSYQTEILLSPITVEIPNVLDLETKLSKLSEMGFDIEKFSDTKLIIYSLPKSFVKYKIDTLKVIDKLLTSKVEEISFDMVLDNIFATKACKGSIKAGQKLSFLEMQQVIKDGFEYIDGQFVCQHGRPSFVQVVKGDIEKLFDR